MRPIVCALVLAVVVSGCSDSAAPTVAAPVAAATPSTSTSAPDVTTTVAAAPEPAAGTIPICATYPDNFGVQFSTRPIRDYGAERPDAWGGLGFSHAGGQQTAVVVVIGDTAAHARNLAMFVPPEVALEVRIGEHTERRLQEAVAAVDEALAGTPGYLGSRVHVIENRAMVEVEADTPEVRPALAATGVADLLCLAPHTGPATAWGTQTYAGDGWRVLGESPTSPLSFVSAATSGAGYQAMWRRHFPGPAPSVDHDTEVVLLFGAAVSGCPQIRFAGVEIRPDAVLPEFAPLAPTGGCRLVARPHGYAVAVDRAALPDRFELRLADVPSGPEARDRLAIDLTDPDGDLGRWGTALVGMTVVPPATGSAAGLDLRFFDASGAEVYAGSDAVEVGESGASLPAHRRPPAELAAGPARLEVAVDAAGTCTWEGELAPFTEPLLRIEVLRTGPGDGPACRIEPA